MLKKLIFIVISIFLAGCNSENIVNDADEHIYDFDFTDEIFENDDEAAEVDDEMTEVDDEMTEVDDEMIEVDDEMTEVDDEDADIIEVPLDGFGVISGDCGMLDSELISDSSFYFLNSIDFMSDQYDDGSDYAFLTEGGKEIWDAGNLGESPNIHSDLFAYEVLARCELAGLLKTEGEISYDSVGKRTDFLVSIDSFKIGVSVAKAVKFPFDAEYTVANAQTLLTSKLSDIAESSLNVTPEDKWEKQILHIIAYADAHAESIITAYDSLDESVKGDTIVIVTVTNGDDSFLY